MQHYPRLSPSGESVAAGDTRVFVNGAEIGPGRQPQWQDERTIICLAPAVGVIRYRLQESGLWAQDWPDRNAEAHDLSVSAAGWAWAHKTPARQFVKTHDERAPFEGYSAVAVAPDGRLALGKHADGSVWVAQPNQTAATLLCQLPCRDLRWTDAGLSFTCYANRNPQPCAWYGLGLDDTIAVVPQEFACAVVFGPRGVQWHLTLDDSRLLLRPDTSDVGYVLSTMANTFNPDIKWMESKQRFRVVWASSSGVFGEAYVDPATDRVDLRKPVTPPVVTPPPVIPPTPEPEPPDMNTEYTSFSWRAARFNKCTPDVGDWPIVLRLDDAYAPLPSEKGVITEWRNTSDWPSTDPGPGPGLAANCGIIAKIGRDWCVATYDWLRFPDQDEKSESLESIVLDQIKESPWYDWRPQVGEVIGLFVCTPARTDARTVNERSAIAWVRIGQRGILAHENGSQPTPVPEPTPTPIPTPQPPQTDPAVLAALERISVAIVGLNERMDRETAIIAEWLVDASGHIKAVGDTCDALMQDAHAFRAETAKQIENLSLPIEAKTRFLNQNITFSGTVGKR